MRQLAKRLQFLEESVTRQHVCCLYEWVGRCLSEALAAHHVPAATRSAIAQDWEAFWKPRVARMPLLTPQKDALAMGESIMEHLRRLVTLSWQGPARIETLWATFAHVMERGIDAA
jgi:hypothetical protein